MKAFIKVIDGNVWRAVLTGWEYLVTKDTEGKETLKLEAIWSIEEDKLAKNSSKALNAIFNGVDVNQFKLISTCEIAKDAWEISHEGMAIV